MDAEPIPQAHQEPSPGRVAPEGAVTPLDARHDRVGWKDATCIAPILLHAVYAYATIPFGPSLIGTRPLLLAGLRGSIPALVAVGAFAHAGSIPLWAALLVPLPNLIFDDPFIYWAGRRYGRRLINYVGKNDIRLHRRIARGERLYGRYGVWAVFLANPLPAPAALFFLAAGETRMPFARFLGADMAGTLVFISGYVALGWVVGEPAKAAAQKISEYGGRVTIALIVITVAWSVWGAWRSSRTPAPG